MMYSFKKYLTQKQGFTMVELLVALSLFAAAVGLIAGIFVQALRTQRAVNNLIGVNSNGSLVIEQMTREIRAGYDFALSNTSLVSPCNDNAQTQGFASYDTLSFVRFRGDATTSVVYSWDETKQGIGRQEGEGAFEPLTAENVAVRQLCFVEGLMNPRPKDIQEASPSRVTIILSLGPTNQPAGQNDVHLQTTVSARILPAETGQ